MKFTLNQLLNDLQPLRMLSSVRMAPKTSYRVARFLKKAEAEIKIFMEHVNTRREAAIKEAGELTEVLKEQLEAEFQDMGEAEVEIDFLPIKPEDIIEGCEPALFMALDYLFEDEP